jgi:hypothetical protein
MESMDTFISIYTESKERPEFSKSQKWLSMASLSKLMLDD